MHLAEPHAINIELLKEFFASRLPHAINIELLKEFFASRRARHKHGTPNGVPCSCKRTRTRIPKKAAHTVLSFLELSRFCRV